MTLLSLAVAFIGGVLLGSWLDVPVAALGMFALASVLGVGVFLSLRRSILPSLFVLVLVLGLLRVSAFDDGDRVSALDEYHSRRPLQVEGVIISDPEPAGQFTRFKLSVDRIKRGDEWEEASGDALVTVRETAALAELRDRPFFRYGDRLALDGTMQPPPEIEDFDYPAYLARQGIGTVMSFPDAELIEGGQGIAFYRWLYSARRSFADSLARVVPEPQASLGQALLLGMRDNIPDDIVDDFRATGTSHVLAISGLHVGILLYLSLTASRFALGRRRQLYLILPLVLIWGYALMSGMSPSVTRAAIMGSVYLAALFFGRPRSILPALGFAAAVMVAVSPSVIWSVSFQLSFAAMAGLALMAEPLTRWMAGILNSLELPSTLHFLLMPASSIISMTIAATIATLPLVAFYFQQVSLVGIPTTLLVMPALPFVLVANAIAGFLGLVTSVLGVPVGWLAWVSTAYVTGVVGAFARLPVSSIETGQLAPALVWAYYGAFVLILFVKAPILRLARRRLGSVTLSLPSAPPFERGVPLLIIAPAISLAALLWIVALDSSDDRLHVAFVDVRLRNTP